MKSETELRNFRSRFRIFDNKVYLNSCSQGALSDVVEAGLNKYTDLWHEQGSPWETWTNEYEAARAAFANFIGAGPEEVAVVASASAGINSIASAMDFSKRPRVVMGEFEFPTMGHIWQAQVPRGANVEFIESQDNRIPPESYEQAIDSQTAIVPLSHISFLNGFRSDIQAIANIAHAKGALVLVDNYQDCGTRPINVKEMGVDIFVTGTLKYLLGPPGVAFLYVREDLIHSLNPTVTGWFAQANPFAYNAKLLDPSPAARRFEAGTPPIPSIYAARPALDLLLEVGLENVAGQINRLAQQMLDGAGELGIKLKTGKDTVGPLIVLRTKDGDSAQAAVVRLADRDIIASCRHDGLRISFHAYNTGEDVDRVLEVLGANLNLFVTADSR